MSRYIERAENLARFIDVTQQVILDQPEGADKQWEPLVRTTGDEEYFEVFVITVNCSAAFSTPP